MQANDRIGEDRVRKKMTHAISSIHVYVVVYYYMSADHEVLTILGGHRSAREREHSLPSPVLCGYLQSGVHTHTQTYLYIIVI